MDEREFKFLRLLFVFLLPQHGARVFRLEMGFGSNFGKTFNSGDIL